MPYQNNICVTKKQNVHKICERNYLSDVVFVNKFCIFDFSCNISIYLFIYRELKDNIIRTQPLDKQQAMAQWFVHLMDGIERNLLMRNRDR